MLLLLAVLLPASIASPAAAQFPDGPFPQTLTVEHGWIDVPATELAPFDVVQIPWWNVDATHGAVIDSVRMLHPDAVIMAYVNAMGLSVPSAGDPGHIVNLFMPQVEDAWYARTDRGEIITFEQWPGMEMMNLTSKCPVIGGRTWGNLLADFAARDILGTGKFDGIHWDYFISEIAWLNDYIDGSMDMDLDGVADDPDSLNAWWQAGLQSMLEDFRAQAGYEVLVDGNGDAAFYPHQNGRFFEAFPRHGWSENLTQADRFRQQGLAPTLLLFATRGEIDDYRTVRYGLCSALLVGGVYWHEPPAAPFINNTIYDEYQVELGRPLGERQEIGYDEVASYDLEGGLPAGLEACGYGRTWITEDPAWVIDGARSLVGAEAEPPRNWNTFACTDPAVLELPPGATFTLELDYRIIEALPSAYFYVGVGGDGVPTSGIHDIMPSAGAEGHVRDTFTLGSASGYYLYFGVKDGGTIVLDTIRLTTGQGGVFRRDFEHGLALVNPGDVPLTVDLGADYYRIQGFQDPAVNNGELTSMVTLPPEDGLILLDEPGGPPSGVDPPEEPGNPQGGGSGESPPVFVAPAVYPNPARLATSPAVTFAGVPPGGRVSIYTVDGRMIRLLDTVAVNGRVAWNMMTDSSRRVAPGLYIAVVENATRQPVKTLQVALRR
ncbi:MAG: putative glycoside hydrolase [Candidatus Eiseniibacteriota bacterium]|jgi:hypothetical protein